MRAVSRLLVALRLGLSLAVVLAFASRTFAAPQAGVAAAVRGEVAVDREGAVGVDVESGAPIYLDDVIRTGPGAGLQILLLDETVFTLGPESDMVIDEFVYSGEPGSDELGVELVRGTFRFVSGRIAKQKPETMRVGLPSGTIGIRGTIVNAAVDDATGRSLVMLAGPGGNDAAGIAPGSISVENAGIARLVHRPGYGVEISGHGQPPSLPFEVPQDDVPLVDRSGSDDSDDSDAARTGDDGARTRTDAEDPSRATSVEPGRDGSSDASDAREDGARTAGDASASRLADADSDRALDGAELLDRTLGGQLRGSDAARDTAQDEDPGTTTGTGAGGGTDPPTMVLATSPTQVTELLDLSGTFTGSYVYTVDNLALSLGGRVDVEVELDFATTQVDFTLSSLVSSALGESGSGFGTTSVPFTAVTGQARYSTSFSYSGTSCSPCPATMNVAFGNPGGGQVAGIMDAVVNVSDNDFVQTESGSVSEVPVQVMSAPR